MPEKEHRCEGMPDEATIEVDEGWELSEWDALLFLLITYCPWCGVKLEESE